MDEKYSRFSTYKDRHAGESVLVCGCGISLNDLPVPVPITTIGVNDVGRKLDPDYLVVLNNKHQFKGDRFRYVENSKAKAIFTHLNLQLETSHVVHFNLGEKSGVDISRPGALPYTRNSPYVAICLAAYMGAKRIGLIGVDFTEHHFFAKTGRHPLTSRLVEMEAEYKRLFEHLQDLGIELVNLSRVSSLKSIPKADLNGFLNRPGQLNKKETGSRVRTVETGSRDVKISIEQYKPGIVGDFLDALADTTRKLGYPVSRNMRMMDSAKNDLAIVWNGRRIRSRGRVLYCEHAWLPRWDYQISHRGINADSHIAPFLWDGKVLTRQQKNRLEGRLEAIRNGCPLDFKYMQTSLEVAKDLPDEFILVPLQMEWDTNIQKHVPRRYRNMQNLVTDISRANPSLSVIYKQHPADVRRGNKHLKLGHLRPQDRIWPHDRANIHQILKSGRCKGIISLNSNVVHDGIIWGVPSIVLGNNIWPTEGASPFLNKFPKHWDELYNLWADREQKESLDAYAHYLISNQWTMGDARDGKKVEELITSNLFDVGNKQSSKVYILPRSSRPVINVAAINKGWFFEDLKNHFRNAAKGECIVRVSEKPRRDADAWIFPRTREASQSPRPERTIVQVHDMFEEALYRQGGDRYCVNDCAGIVLTHPGQREILSSASVELANKLVLERPIGALSSFTLKESNMDKFTVAWVGRPVRHFGEDVKRIEWFVEAVSNIKTGIRVVLLGERMEAQYKELSRLGMDVEYYNKRLYPIERYPELYRTFDCVVITSSSEAGPLCLFEALASGIPVVTTPVGWSPNLIKNGKNGYIVNSPEEITKSLLNIHTNKEYWDLSRGKILSSLNGYTMESWVKENLSLAMKMIEGEGRERKAGSL